MAKVTVYRFRDEVALSVTGVGGETVYLSPDDALQLIGGLRAVVKSCKNERFAQSACPGAEVDARCHGEPVKGES